MTHAYARGSGEIPAPRKIAEPRQRREAVSSRAAWCPDSAGPYRLPAGIRDRLLAALAGRKNRDAAFAWRYGSPAIGAAPGGCCAQSRLIGGRLPIATTSA